MVKIQKIYCHNFSGAKLHNKMVLAVFTRCYKYLGQKWAKNGPKTGQKRAKNGKYCNNCSGSKLHNKMVLAVYTRCFKNLGQKWPKKMVKIQKNYCHHFSGLKLPKKMLLAVFTRCLVPEIQFFLPILAKIGIFGSKFQPNRNLYS